jgi:hypothetical protein
VEGKWAMLSCSIGHVAIPLGRLSMTASESSGSTEGDDDCAPSSEVRASSPDCRCLLRVFTCLRAADPAGPWLTVTDDQGVTHYEGPLTDDGVELSLPARAAGRVCLHLETASWHRQAQVEINADLVEHVFT